MKLLVIGKSGQLAQAIRMCASTPDVRIVFAGRPDVDVARAMTVRHALETHQPSVVVNTAAHTAVDQAETERERAFAINDAGADHVARACHDHGVPLIHISTDYVFDGRKAQPYAELDAINPLNVYGASKANGEDRVREVCPQHIILRTSWLFSVYGQNFIKTMLRLAASREAVHVVNDQTGSPTCATSLATGILAIAQVLNQSPTSVLWGTYHAAGSSSASWFDLARYALKKSEELAGPTAKVLPVSTAAYNAAAQRPLDTRLNCEKLLGRFEIALPDWRVGVSRCVAQLVKSQVPV